MRQLVRGIRRRHIRITKTAIATALTTTTTIKVTTDITETTIGKSEAETTDGGNTPNEANDLNTGPIGGEERRWKAVGVNFRENMNVTNVLMSGKTETDARESRQKLVISKHSTSVARHLSPAVVSTNR